MLRFNGGPGAFTEDGHEKATDDIFGYKNGKMAFPEPKEPEVDPLRKQEVIAAPTDGKPVFEQKVGKDDLSTVDEFGVGFYVRYLSRYPV